MLLFSGDQWVNSLAPERCGYNFKLLIFTHIKDILSIYWKLTPDECHKTDVTQRWFRQWLGAVKQQAITWTSVDQDLSHHIASQGHNELSPTPLPVLDLWAGCSCQSAWCLCNVYAVPHRPSAHGLPFLCVGIPGGDGHCNLRLSFFPFLSSPFYHQRHSLDTVCWYIFSLLKSHYTPWCHLYSCHGQLP